jgi:hypothetical protein
MNSWPKIRTISFFTIGATMFTLLLAGCGELQFNSEGRELMKPLQTALSAKKAEWLDATEKKIVELHDGITVTDTEFQALEKIIQQARTGDWKGAHHAVVQLIDGQRPNADDETLAESRKRNRVVEHHRKQSRDLRR